MKKKGMVFTMLLATGLTVQAQAQEILTRFKVRNTTEVRPPIMNDSINPQGQKHSIRMLLKTPIALDMPQADMPIMVTDSTGCLQLEKAEKNNRFYLLKTIVRAERYMTGKLAVISPVRWELFVDGMPRFTKDMAEDSISPRSRREVALRLEPERDYEISIKLLTSAEDKAAPALRCEFIKDAPYKEVGCALGPDIKKRFSLGHTEFGNRVMSVSISPSGKYMLTRFWNNYGPKRSRVYTQLSEVKSGKILIDQARDGMRWMPQSDKLYYTVMGPYGNNIQSLDPVSLREETIVEGIPEQPFSWAPNEQFLIYFPKEKGVEERGPLRRIASPADRIPNSRGRNFLAKYDLSTGVYERLTFGNHSTHLQDISADGRYLLYSTSKEDIKQRPFSLSSLYRVDLDTRKVDTLFHDVKFLNDARFSPDGSQLVLTGSPEAFGGIGKNCGKHPIANDFDTQAFIMNLATKAIEPITKDFNPTVSLLQWNQGDGCIYFNTDDADCKHIYRYSPQSKQFEMLNLEVDVISAFSLPKRQPQMAAYVGQSDHTAGVAYLYDMKKKKSRLIADPMKPLLDELELGQTEPWNFTASDGTVITGRMCLPPNFDPNKKYPLIVYYYGGTTPTTKGISNPYCAQLFASRDYVVYIIQPSGTIGFGQEFSARHVNAWGKRTADDIIEGTKQFCKEHPFVNEKRIGCIGASYGGFMTQYLQTQTDIFAAAVSHAGISDVTSYWGEGYWGYSYNAIAAADSYPWNNPDLFTKQGSLFNADKINTPLLLLHGTVDTNVPIGESIQLFNALKILGKTVELVTVNGENHFIADYSKRILWHNSIMAWFARWLQDRPEWWNELYPKRHL